MKELSQILGEHLGDKLQEHVILRVRDDENEPPAKQACLEDDVLMEHEPFTFTRQGEWLAVFYDHDYYSDGRMWRVLEVDDIIQGYSEIKSHFD